MEAAESKLGRFAGFEGAERATRHFYFLVGRPVEGASHAPVLVARLGWEMPFGTINRRGRQYVVQRFVGHVFGCCRVVADGVEGQSTEVGEDCLRLCRRKAS